MSYKQRRKKKYSKAQNLTGKITLAFIGIVATLAVLFSLYWFVLRQAPIDYRYYKQIADNSEQSLLEDQSMIMEAINRNHVRPEDVGSLFIPNYPAEYIDIHNIPQLNIPYYNQNDQRWRNESYGTDSSQKLWENGCAIVALAMVDAYYNHGQTTPTDILRWAGNHYYMHNVGTAWTIYQDYGDEHGYQVIDLERDFASAMQYVQAGYPVIVAVGPGTFTLGGHVMVIRGYDGYYVYLNDPNDSPQTFFSIRGIPGQILVDDGLNYWAFLPQ